MFQTLDPDSITTREMYQHMISFITPRPIAWVSTISQEGVTNLAPFSFFQGVCAKPPTVLFCPVNDREGRPKDTLRNVQATGEFVVNIVNFANAEAMNNTSAPLPYGVSEFEKFSIPSTPSVKVKPPRVAMAPVALECVLHQIVHVGQGALAGNIVIGRIVLAHIADNVRGADGFCDPAKLDTIARLGGDGYARTTERFTVSRPK
jgi:flavin reductase (DIM6/NTAB) family NADH-FMN oxidoreductase RutF